MKDKPIPEPSEELKAQCNAENQFGNFERVFRSAMSVPKAEVLKREAAKNLVQLAPYRTFRDIEQPVSTFLFRIQQSGENMPTFALFEADGGAWKIEAVQKIAARLSAGLKDAVVVS